MLLKKQVSSSVIKRILIVTMSFITFTLVVVGLNASVNAQEDSFSCTNATLNGSYGLQIVGFRLPAEGSYIPATSAKRDKRGQTIILQKS